MCTYTYILSATSILQKQCDGKSACKVYAKDDTFGDPCPAISKFLEVYWDCVEDGKSGEFLSPIFCTGCPKNIVSASVASVEKL